MNYNILEDIYFTNFLNSKPKLTPPSIKGYRQALTKFCKANEKPLSEIINDCKSQQDVVIEKTIFQENDADGNQIIKKQLIKFDVNAPDSKVKLFLNRHIEYCLEKGNSNVTINNNMTQIKAFLKFYDIILPKMETLDDDSRNWYLLTKEDFKYIINESTIGHASLIKFLMSAGMRAKDVTSLTIGDFMEATKDYHNFTDVDDFINNAPDGMIGTWNFHPHKTQKFKIQCVTFNDPESSNLILQNLRKIKNHVDRDMSKNDALFGSQMGDYKKSITPGSIAVEFLKKNQKLHDWRVLKIKERIQNGELSNEDYDKEVSKIPRFHAHGCRKFFETTIARNCGNLRICTLMEGHVSPVATDSSYIKQNVSDVKEYYMAALDDFSLEKTEVKVYTSEIRKEMEAKIRSLETKNEELERKLDKINELESVVNNITDWMGDLDL